jgi:Fur family transcriptional regulator, zinc uptake regulator
MATKFSPRIEAQLDHADAFCHRRGARLTPLRRTVLGLILDSASPTGAYELLDRLRAGRKGAAPPTVYRALDFLLEHGLIHRLERLSAFIGCVTPGDEAGHAHGHAAQFLICGSCGRAIEVEEPAVLAALVTAAERAGFMVSGATIEAIGLCAACRAAASPSAA